MKHSAVGGRAPGCYHAAQCSNQAGNASCQWRGFLPILNCRSFRIQEQKIGSQIKGVLEKEKWKFSAWAI
jgi:hypothetical protein